MAKAEADAAKREAIEAERGKVAEKRAKTEAEIMPLDVERARLQRVRGEEAVRAQEEAKRRAAEAATAGLEHSAFRMKINLDAEDSRSREGSGRAPHHGRKGKGKTTERARRAAEGHPHASDPFVTCSNGDGPERRHHREPMGCGLGVAGAGGGKGDSTPPGLEVEGLAHSYRSKQGTPSRPLSWTGSQ